MGVLGRWRRDLGFLRTLGPVALDGLRLAPDRKVELSDLLARHFRKRRDRVALVDEERTLTWGELDLEANRVAHWALASGLERGDVVALLMENRVEYVSTWLGLSRVGVVTALLNTDLRGDRLAHCLQEARARLVIAGRDLEDAAREAIDGLEERPQLFVSGGGRGGSSSELAAGRDPGGSSASGAPDLDAMLAKESDAPVDERDREARRAGDLLFLIYTSGTTGLPKAARLSHARAARIALGAYHSQRLRPDDRTYCCLPLYHTAGGIMATGAILLAGGTLVIARRFSASRFASDCVRHQITTFQYIGELCRYLLQSPRQPDEARLRIRVAIGNGLRPEVWQPFQERFGIGRIVEFYGATEGNVPLVNVAGKPGAVGQLPFFMRRPMGIELLRFDIDSEEPVRGKDGFCERCAVGEPGELVGRITALAAFEGYTNEEATRKKILRDVFEAGDAYFRTGDLLRCDEEGFFYFVDRIGDTFRWKGENVSTAEVAVVLGSETGVAEANVYGVAVPGVEGRAGMAAIVAGEDFSLPSLQERIDRELAAWARPLFLRLLPSMEITGTFKHRKIDLVREAFDPAEVPDPLYVRDPDSGTYVPLDAERYAGITSGALRL